MLDQKMVAKLSVICKSSLVHIYYLYRLMLFRKTHLLTILFIKEFELKFFMAVLICKQPRIIYFFDSIAKVEVLWEGPKMFAKSHSPFLNDWVDYEQHPSIRDRVQCKKSLALKKPVFSTFSNFFKKKKYKSHFM